MDETTSRQAEEVAGARDRLRGQVLALAPQRFAVLDGAQFDDLRFALKRSQIFARPLILGASSDIENAGPWLVAVDEAPLLDVVIDLVGPKPAVVFWSCQAGSSSLFRHLRTLAMVELPDGETVYFRHADPRVMRTMATLLESHQTRHFFGPAAAIHVFDTTFSAADAIVNHRGAIA